MPPLNTPETPSSYSPEQNTQPEHYQNPEINREFSPHPENNTEQPALQPHQRESLAPSMRPGTQLTPRATTGAQSLSDINANIEQNRRQDLVHTALHKGLLEAVEEAKKYNDPYLLDKFHDDLVDRLKSELIKAKKLTEE